MLSEPVPSVDAIVAEFRRQFPQCRETAAERDFLAAIVRARAAGVGYGWMRQAAGIAWKVADPVGYIDDDRVLELFRDHDGFAGPQ